jgi:hypothetical protein
MPPSAGSAKLKCKNRGKIATMSLNTEISNFYIVVATVIPVVFLGLVLQGGFWDWIEKKIKTGGYATLRTRILVPFLQLASLVVVCLGTASEIISLDVLMTGENSQVKDQFVFYSAAALIVMLGIVLLAKIPGIFWIGFGDVALAAEADEEIKSNLSVYRWVKGPWPWRTGVLFMTNKRVVWLTKRELGLEAASEIEITITDLREANYYTEPLWSKMIRVLVLSTIPGGYWLNIVNSDGESYRFALSERRLATVKEYLKEYVEITTSDGGRCG